MKTRFFSQARFTMLSLITVLSAFTFLPLQINASGFIIIDVNPPSFPRPQRPIPLTIKHHDVKVTIEKQIATTKITQVFHNPNNHDVEGTYIFPVGQNVSINKFSMLVNKKPLYAKILNKDKARTIYEEIVRRRKDPALLEYVGRDMIKARVYPIGAHKDVQISFEYSEILTANSGSIKYQHSLGNNANTHKNYNKNFDKLDKISIDVKINSSKNIVNIYSPTHELTIKKSGQTKATVSCIEKNINSSRDFILYYTIPNDEIGFNVVTYKEGQKDGFFLAMMSPNISRHHQTVVAKNIVFVVDRSGSMGRKKMEQAKDALKFCLQNLNEQDHFNIICFDDEIDLYKNRLIRASHTQIQQALSYVNNLHSRGCTNIDDALKTALQILPESDNPNMIIFLTDGLPNVGQSNVTRIIENAKRRNRTNTRIFSFGVGHDVNTTLLDKISLDNKGTSDYVRPSENIETVVSNFYKKVANPVLTDLVLQATGTTIKEIFPINLPDLFHGSQLLVLGRYTNGGPIELDLSGKQNTTDKHYIFTTEFTKNDTSNNFLPRLWATRKIAYLIDAIVLEGKNKHMVDEIVRLSKKYGIITEYTSFLIQDDNDDFDTLLDNDKMKYTTLDSLYFASEDQVGKCAVSRAKNQKSLRSCSTVCTNYTTDIHDSSNQQKIRTVGNRTFYLKNSIWIDADHDASLPITKIKLFSKKYFELLKQNPALGTYFALGKNVIIKTDNGSIQVCDYTEQNPLGSK